MPIIKEFKEFALRGNVVDMAVGIIIGAAFGRVVSSLVEGIIMPPLGILIGGVDFTELIVTLREAKEGSSAVVINYGIFLQGCLDFLIIALAIFLVIRGLNYLKRKEEKKAPQPPPVSAEVQVLTEIRDLLKKSP